MQSRGLLPDAPTAVSVIDSPHLYSEALWEQGEAEEMTQIGYCSTLVLALVLVFLQKGWFLKYGSLLLLLLLRDHWWTEMWCNRREVLRQPDRCQC